MRALKQTPTPSSPDPNSNSPPPSSSLSSASSSWVHLRSVLFVVTSSSPASSSSSDRGRLKSPWSRKKRKHALSPQQWRGLYTPDGKLRDGGLKFLKKVRSGGVDPSIRAEVWPFLLGVYDLTSSEEERDAVRVQKRKEYERLRKQCRSLLKFGDESMKLNDDDMNCHKEGGIQHAAHGDDSSMNCNKEGDNQHVARGDDSSMNCNKEGDNQHVAHGDDSPSLGDVISARESISSDERGLNSGVLLEEDDSSRGMTNADASVLNTESSDSDSSGDPEVSHTFPSSDGREDNDPDFTSKNLSPLVEVTSKFRSNEDFTTWQRIIRLDAVRANAEWIAYAPSQAAVSDDKARHLAEVVGLKDYDHLEPSRIFHASRLVTILEAYALYDPEIGYCQGMSDLLSPIITVITEDHEAFWCFVGFMRKARHNFRLDEVGIRKQLNIVSRIIRFKDSHLYRHLQNLEAEDCFFVYRMVVVLFRRELTFEQTLCLWEVMWADQAAIRAGVGKSSWSRIRQRAPPTEDLLLYAIAASVLQKRKLIIEKYNSMDEIIRECNSMAGQLDVWKLLDGAHDLVVTLHEKIETSI
ncbi:small G protein signaling modulator 2-like isoform X3 [Cucurbita pepo subsp. pepo]|uniref:small G protein signaling modulator 2-like isoform X1 n=1 Tax=Cucurbita pepo subsp. pepo TaxID=3664 RepID=UPI000C9D9A55|nr:small G protein signaling modulator 2-like isoform X1 [Cucurbita pepo subsp. pepo]XP_023541556.1 small G protein signaling modulator 2-like isoform X2 [Cucurbita pepo subsp. pepo]XP_023541557.1 small G protein signaling modulator 2-like isoform X3 [Cucurbita pepo subsp. pepo]